jgi:hypothetical protein
MSGDIHINAHVMMIYAEHTMSVKMKKIFSLKNNKCFVAAHMLNW